jgi:hypothetical protein
MMMWVTVILAVCLLQDTAVARPQVEVSAPGEDPVMIFLYALNTTEEAKEELENSCLSGNMKLSNLIGAKQPYKGTYQLNPTPATQGSSGSNTDPSESAFDSNTDPSKTFTSTQGGNDLSPSESVTRGEVSGTIDRESDVDYGDDGSEMVSKIIYTNRDPDYVIGLGTHRNDASDIPMWMVAGHSPRIPPNEPWIEQLRARGYSVDPKTIVNVNPECYRKYYQDDSE